MLFFLVMPRYGPKKKKIPVIHIEWHIIHFDGSIFFCICVTAAKIVIVQNWTLEFYFSVVWKIQTKSDGSSHSIHMCDKIFRMHNGDCLTMCTLCANKFLYGTLTHVKSILDDGTYHWAYVNARLRATIFFYFISISFPFFFAVQ